MRVLIFGASGSAGGAVLRACLAASDVSGVRAIVRRPLDVSHAKLREIVHQTYDDYSPIPDAFRDVDVCLYCLGISVNQVSGEAEYRRITHDFAVAAAQALRAHSPAAAFHFVSGAGAGLDSRFMWARVKAETERELIETVGALCWRPASIDGVPSRSEPRLYRWLRPVMRLLRPFRGLYVEGGALGRAMLVAARTGMRARIVENREIRDLADRDSIERGTR